MNTFSDLLKYLKIYRRHLGRRMYLIFVLSGAVALTEGFGIALLLPLLKAAETGEATEEMGTAEQWLHEFLSWMGIAESIVGILAFIAIVFIGKGLLKLSQGGYKGYLQAQLLRELKSKLFDAYSGMSYRYYISQNTGHFVNVINGQVGRFFSSFASFTKFYTKIISAVTYFGVAFLIAWRFAVFVLMAGGGLLFLFRYLNRYVRALSRRLSEEMSQLNKLLIQSLQSLQYLLATGRVEHLRSGVMGSIRELTKYIFRQRMAQVFTGAIKEPFSVLLIVIVVIVQVAVLQEPIAPIFVAILLFHRGMNTVVDIQSRWQNTMNLIGSVEMVSEELNEVLDRQEESGPRSIGPLREGIEFRDVCHAYDEEDGDVIHNVNLSVPVNTTVALVGESGAGKSTLVDMMTLMLKPRTGEIRIDGVPHDEIDLDSWRAQIGYVSQETVVFDDTIANNICLWQGHVEEDPDLRERVVEAARHAHAHHFIRDLPNGYQTLVGDQGVRLSGGQRQRLFVARELFKQPNLLLLDEATSDLDAASEQHIQDSIDALKGEVTVVIIAHRLSTIQNADQVHVLDEGRVVEKGSYHQLRTAENGQFREMVEMQSL
jgi:ABC-type multidrug transport system fused ATPase/permease subunit